MYVYALQMIGMNDSKVYCVHVCTEMELTGFLLWWTEAKCSCQIIELQLADKLVKMCIMKEMLSYCAHILQIAK